MIDDVDDKIRRNLLVYSAVTIATLYLGMPIWSLISVNSPLGIATSQGKIVIIAASIQLYLLLRYRFSAQALRSWRRYLVESASICRRNVVADITKRLKQFRKNADVDVFTPALQDYIAKEETDPAMTHGMALKMQQMTIGNIAFQSTWRGDFSCATELASADGSTSIRSGGIRIDFSYSGLHKARILTRSMFEIMMYSRGAFELALPSLLGVAAIMALVHHYLVIS